VPRGDSGVSSGRYGELERSTSVYTILVSCRIVLYNSHDVVDLCVIKLLEEKVCSKANLSGTSVTGPVREHQLSHVWRIIWVNRLVTPAAYDDYG
jgi:hypothetical protein